MRTRPLYDVLALLTRIGVGVVFIAHGWQKIQVGITATSKSMDAMDVPAPTAAAIYATFAELLGGLALILGLGLPVAGLLLFLDMAGAFVFVHAGNGLFLIDQNRVENGFELVLVLGLASLLFAAGAGGRLTLDHQLSARRDADPDEFETPWPPPAEDSSSTLPIPRPSRPSKPRPELEPEHEPAPAPAPKAAGRFRRKSRAAAETEPAKEPSREPTKDTPRLAADIIGDTSQDVRVAGRRKTDGAPKPD